MSEPYDAAPVAGTIDQARAAAAVRELLIAVGEDPDRPGLQDTPARVARAYAETFGGLHLDPLEVLATTFEEDHDELVLVKDISMYSTCEHHLVPSTEWRTSATSRVPTGGSRGCRSWPGWSTSTPAAPRCRSG